MANKVFVTGYTGEVGKALVNEYARLINEGKCQADITLIGRRQVDYTSSSDDALAATKSMFHQKIVDFDSLKDKFSESFQGFDIAFCCLGTTRGKSGVEGFRKVDYDYVLSVAEVARTNGCSQFHLVSSKGANASARLLYTKTKGEIEAAVSKLDFPFTAIYRPGLLLCQRTESRPFEGIVRGIFGPISKMGWGGSMAVSTVNVAKAMIATSNKWLTEKEEHTQRHRILENDEIVRIATNR